MADSSHLIYLQWGDKKWNAWRKTHPNIQPNLSGIRICEHIPSNPFCTYDGRSSLYNYDLRNANLIGTNFTNCDMLRVKLDGADLRMANFTNASLRKASLANAICGLTVFGKTDLLEAEGLDQVDHRDESVIDIDTLETSHSIPESFIKACGYTGWKLDLYRICLGTRSYSDAQIVTANLRSNREKKIRDLVLSYSSADKDFVHELADNLELEGVNIFDYKKHFIADRKWERQYRKALAQGCTLLPVLSEKSKNSRFVHQEIRWAYDIEKMIQGTPSYRNVLCPVALDDIWQKNNYWSDDITKYIGEHSIIYFDQWLDSQKFNQSFSRLIAGLRNNYVE